MSFDPWTLGFQAINFLVLVWLLRRFFWTPVAGMIAARQAQAVTLLTDAATKQTEAGAALARIETTRRAMAAEREAILLAAHAEAETARLSVLEAARAEAAALQDTAKASSLRAAAALKATVIGDATCLALTIAGRLMGRLTPQATDAAFLGWMVDSLAALPEDERKTLAGADLDVVSAGAQDQVAQDRITRAVLAALGTSATLTFRTDPALIAGHELHSPHFTLRNSWAADLARIAETLAQPDAALPNAA